MTRWIMAALAVSMSLCVAASVAAQETNSGRRDSTRASRPTATPTIDSAAAIRIPSSGVAGAIIGNPVEPVAGRVAGARVMHSSAEPGTVPRLDLRYRAGRPASAQPLHLFDGVPLVAPPVEIPASEVAELEVVPSLAGTHRLGSSASGGMLHFLSRSPTPASADFDVAARIEAGSQWVPAYMSRARHHNFLVGPDGGYVDTDGNPVPASERVRDPDDIADNPYPGLLFDHDEALFQPGTVRHADVTVRRRLGDGALALAGGHRREQTSVRDGDEYARTHVRLRAEQRVADRLAISVSALHALSNLPGIPDADRYMEAAVMVRPDVDVLDPSDEYGYVPLLERGFGIMTNPLSTVNRALDAERTRSVVGVRARGLIRPGLELEGAIGYDRLQEEADRRIPVFDVFTGALRSTGIHTMDRTRSRRTLEAALTATGRRFGADVSGTLAATMTRVLDGGEETEIFEGASSWRRWDVPRSGTVLELGGEARHPSGLELFASLRREKLLMFVGSDARFDHTAAIGFDAARGWLETAWLDRAALRLSSTSASRTFAFDPTDEDAWAAGVGENTEPEREHELELSLDVRAFDRHDLRVAYARSRTTGALYPIQRLPYPTWENAGTVAREVMEASIGTELVRDRRLNWSVMLVVDRPRHRMTDWKSVTLLVGNTWWRAGASVGEIWGYRFARRIEDLGPLHAASADAFEVNDDGLLVPVGPGGSLADPHWGTSVSVDGQTYDWGLPLTSPELFVKLGDRTPDLGLGLASTLRWGILTASVRLAGQVGGEAHDQLRQYAYLAETHADLDQADLPAAERKPLSYYHELRTGIGPNDWFIVDATHLRLRELTVSIAPAAMHGLSLTLVGENLMTWSRSEGVVTDVPLSLDSPPSSAAGVFGFPRPRSLSFQIGYGF